MLVLEGRDFFSKHKHCALEISITKPKCIARLTQQSMAPWYLFDSTTREVSSINVTLGHLLLKVTSKRFGKEEAYFDYFDRSYIRGFGNAQHQGYGKIQWHDLLSETK